MEARSNWQTRSTSWSFGWCKWSVRFLDIFLAKLNTRMTPFWWKDSLKWVKCNIFPLALTFWPLFHSPRPRRPLEVYTWLRLGGRRGAYRFPPLQPPPAPQPLNRTILPACYSKEAFKQTGKSNLNRLTNDSHSIEVAVVVNATSRSAQPSWKPSQRLPIHLWWNLGPRWHCHSDPHSPRLTDYYSLRFLVLRVFTRAPDGGRKVRGWSGEVRDRELSHKIFPSPSP